MLVIAAAAILSIVAVAAYHAGYCKRSDEIIREIHAERDLRAKARIKAKR